jgi:hypothetical protein
MSENEPKQTKIDLPTAEALQRELSSAKSIDDFFGKEGIFARLFSKTLEQMLEAELTGQLGYAKYEAKGRGSGNNRNGHYKRKVKSSAGEVSLAVPREGCADVPFATVSLSQSCCTSMKLQAMSWKIRLWLCTPAG